MRYKDIYFAYSNLNTVYPKLLLCNTDPISIGLFLELRLSTSVDFEGSSERGVKEYLFYKGLRGVFDD